MSTSQATLNSLKVAFDFLRRDGIFVKASVLSEDKFLIESATYVTDTDEGKDIDCLFVGEDDLGLGGSCICDDITTGEWLKEGAEAPRGCVECPVCQRLARPWKLKKICYNLSLNVHETSVSLLNSRPNQQLKPMPAGMSEKIIDLMNVVFPEKTYGNW
jgi:hypothetical protein